MGDELTWCQHRGPDGVPDCGELIHDPERRQHRLCEKHRQARVRLPQPEKREP